MILRVLLLLAFLYPFALSAQEICNNGIDDDGDGLIDLNDPDCPCSTLITPDNIASYIRNPSFEERGCCPFGFVSIAIPSVARLCKRMAPGHECYVRLFS